MWINANDDVPVNLDMVMWAEWSGTGGEVRLHLSSTTFLTATFGTTEAEAKAGIKRVVGSVDPANYVD